MIGSVPCVLARRSKYSTLPVGRATRLHCSRLLMLLEVRRFESSGSSLCVFRLTRDPFPYHHLAMQRSCVLCRLHGFSCEDAPTLPREKRLSGELQRARVLCCQHDEGVL